MQAITDLFNRFSNLPDLVQWAGLFGLTIIVFSETGLLIGVFLPGDSLLVTAGLLAAHGYLNVYQLAPVLTLAAILGNSLGYFIGRASGPRIFNRENSLFFNKKHAMRAHEFEERYGRATIVIAQFIPIIRTFSPVIAGVGGMKFREFLTFNVLGAVVWVWSMLGIGYFLGNYIPGIDRHIEIVVVIVVFISLLPGLIGGLNARRKRRLIIQEKDYGVYTSTTSLRFRGAGAPYRREDDGNTSREASSDVRQQSERSHREGP
ncbi:MAG TPA: VTT domain-containing protein [Gemmatimonadaceae bacterium]|nr:VTT domain-containing protein [Gemmatimonadaceae bacterium]